MIERHVAHVKARFGLPTYVSKRGDVLADCGGKALVAAAREIAMNDPEPLWTARYRHLNHDTADHLAKGDWTAA